MANGSFSILEMLKIAILMEEEGYKFYTNGIKHTTGKVQKFLKVAAGQEFVHREKFQKLYDKISRNKQIESEYLLDSEVSGYLRGLIEDRVFDKTEQPEDAFKDLKTAIQHAIETERLTVQVYSHMYNGISKKDAKDMLSVILKEEKSHVEYFSKLLDDMVD
ncbi:MAG TPA: rubrerythrin family protein [Clostridium sp.]|jgi:rubrerythrin|uniref:Ferritin family protein n=1 Tax=Clostridium lapidicellarium TaxID=3240931 RepID=A0ABV4DZ91_9CLOT|nr:ferritin family protein [uncultured Clostridium sp.]HBC95212.1 rubrerythrin family protein [Clostridium sp.]